MIFVINKKKYDTEKMEKIAKVEKFYKLDSWFLKQFGAKDLWYNYNCILWRTKKNNWFLTSNRDYDKIVGEAIDENEAKSLLLKHDIEKYEEIFGELEEA